MIEHLSETLAKRGITIKEVNTNASGYDNTAYMFNNGGGTAIYLPFTMEYTIVKKDGTVSGTKKEKVSMYLSFCPFCGKKIRKERV